MALRLRLILPPVAIPVDGNIQCHNCRMDLQPGIDDFHCLGCPHDSAMNVRRRNIARDLLHRMLNFLVAKTGPARLEEPEQAALPDARGIFPSRRPDVTLHALGHRTLIDVAMISRSPPVQRSQMTLRPS